MIISTLRKIKYLNRPDMPGFFVRYYNRSCDLSCADIEFNNRVSYKTDEQA